MKYHSMCNRISSILAAVTGLLLTGVLALSVVNILLRNVFSISWLSADVILKLMFVWMVFIGASVAYYNVDHLKMDFLSMRFSKKTKKITELVFLATTLILLVIMVIYGFNVSIVRMTIPFESNKAIPTGYLYSSVPISAIIMIFFTFDHLGNLLKYGTLKRFEQKAAEQAASPESESRQDVKN